MNHSTNIGVEDIVLAPRDRTVSFPDLQNVRILYTLSYYFFSIFFVLSFLYKIDIC